MMSDSPDNNLPVSKTLSESYSEQIEEMMKAESVRRIQENHDPKELERLNGLSDSYN